LGCETWFNGGTVGSQKNGSVRLPTVIIAKSARKPASTVCP
jgi:hypothetical protein